MLERFEWVFRGDAESLEFLGVLAHVLTELVDRSSNAVQIAAGLLSRHLEPSELLDGDTRGQTQVVQVVSSVYRPLDERDKVADAETDAERTQGGFGRGDGALDVLHPAADDVFYLRNVGSYPSDAHAHLYFKCARECHLFSDYPKTSSIFFATAARCATGP